MKYLIALFLFHILILTSSALEIQYCTETGQCELINFSDKYSQKDFTNQDFSDATDLVTSTKIYSSTFYQEATYEASLKSEIEKHIFPENMTGVTFYNCNLDNVYIPSGNEIIGGTNKKIKVQNDLVDWVLNEDLTPKEPMGKEYYIQRGGNVDPKKIPSKKYTLQEREQYEKDMAIYELNHSIMGQ